MDCEAAAIALAAGEPGPAHAAHLATCARCRARAALVESLAAARLDPGAAPPAESTAPPIAGAPIATLPIAAPPPIPGSPITERLPTVSALRAATRVRAARRAAVVTVIALSAAAAVVFVRPAPPAAPVDLFAVLDDADRAAGPAATLPEEDLLGLLDDGAEDPLDPADPLIDALLGEGSL